MSTPKITALVPSYNHGKYIRQRIDSILKQTYSNIELIVIDDRSDDDSDGILKDLQSQYGFQYIRRQQNSGTPFAAWEDICSLSSGDYIWVCESDDIAEPEFIETALKGFSDNPDAVLFYCNSNVIDEEGKIIDHTESYFHDIWKETRWDRDFIVDGLAELENFQIRGQVVPNMSSALIPKQAFKAGYSPFLKKLKLTGDWLFIGDVLKQGKAIFCHQALSNFRKHEVTSRVRVKSARSQAEFIITKYLLYKNCKTSIKSFAKLMSPDVVRFLYEPASFFDVVKALISISVIKTISLGLLLIMSTSMNKEYIDKFRQRYKHAKK